MLALAAAVVVVFLAFRIHFRVGTDLWLLLRPGLL
jgi:hypothetical protein